MSTYTYTAIDDPLGNTTSAYGINASGQVVGSYRDAASTHGFLYANGTYTTLDDPLGITQAFGINDAGQIVGIYADSTGYHGFLYNGGIYTTLDGPLGTASTQAYGINNAGQIDGYYQDSTGFHGFLYSGGIYTTLDDPLAAATFPTGINNAGQIVGFEQDSTGSGFSYHAFLYSGGTYTTLNDRSGTPVGINDSGQIVGARYLYSGGTYTALADPLTSSTTYARGINDTGQIVGYYSASFGEVPLYHGFEATLALVPALAATLDDFGSAQGWGSSAFTRELVADNVQHDTLYLGFGAVGTVVAWGVPGTSPALAEFGAQSVPIHDFGTDQGYDSTRERGVAVYGTGTSNGLSYQQDIVYGQGNAGIYFYRPLSAATQSDGVVVPTYETSPELYREFGTNQGWTQHYNFQTARTTHATPDIVGFGNGGMIVAPQAFAPEASTAQEYLAAGTAAIGNAAGWDSLNDVRTILDQNGKPISLDSDGIPDFVGMGPNGLVYAYGSKDANGNYRLGAVQTAHISGSASDLGDAQGWNDATTPRIIVADPNSGYDDIFAFGAAGVYVAPGQNPATHGGEPFGQLYLGVADFGLNQGWTVGATPRIIADVNGDGIPDIVGFGASTTFTDLGSADASGKVTWAPNSAATINDFGSAEGWDSTTFRGAADVSGTGQADLVLSGSAGTQIWHYS